MLKNLETTYHIACTTCSHSAHLDSQDPIKEKPFYERLICTKCKSRNPVVEYLNVVAERWADQIEKIQNEKLYIDIQSQEEQWHSSESSHGTNDPRIEEEQQNLALQVALDQWEDDQKNSHILSYEENYSSADEVNDYEQSIDDFESDQFEDSMGDRFES
tara:strand:+ start:75 stop:554 length:480 start_codon:yes stop_codon:yes gene_type:complete